MYRESFRDIESEFRNVVENERTAMLEWTSREHTATGDAVQYSGVSLLELGEGKVRRFRTYFDPGALAHHANEWPRPLLIDGANRSAAG